MIIIYNKDKYIKFKSMITVTNFADIADIDCILVSMLSLLKS